jgi:hypothetical protein
MSSLGLDARTTYTVPKASGAGYADARWRYIRRRLRPSSLSRVSAEGVTFARAPSQIGQTAPRARRAQGRPTHYDLDTRLFRHETCRVGQTHLGHQLRSAPCPKASNAGYRCALVGSVRSNRHRKLHICAYRGAEGVPESVGRRGVRGHLPGENGMHEVREPWKSQCSYLSDCLLRHQCLRG